MNLDELEALAKADARFIEHTGERTVSYLWIERAITLIASVRELEAELLTERQARERVERERDASAKEASALRDVTAMLKVHLDELKIATTAFGGEGDAEVEINTFERMNLLCRRLENAEQRLAEQGDKTPIDEAWVSNTLDSGNESNLRDMKRFCLGRSEWGIRLLANACEGPKCWRWSLWIGSAKCINEPTRADVLRLLSALNIPAQGTTDER